jgi:hypothetical protein
MTIEQLRKLAHEQLKDFERQSVGIKAETFVEAGTRQAIIFRFKCKDRGDEVDLVLDSESGAFVQLSHSPGQPERGVN